MYSCPDCEADLEILVRELEIAEDETVHVLESGAVIATKLACTNEKCVPAPAADDDAGEIEKEEAEFEEMCGEEYCTRESRHRGRHNRAGAPT